MLLLPTFNSFIGLFIILYASDITYANNSADGFQSKSMDSSFISTLFNMFIKPYLKPLHMDLTPRADDNIVKTIKKVVKQKIKELQPFLQDNDEGESDDHFTFKGNDETTIIEFIRHPNEEVSKDKRNDSDTFKSNMQRYKTVRNKIYEALDAEYASDKTKTLVMQTLDELISKVVETQCEWKSGISNRAHKIGSYDNRFMIPRTLINKWREEWQNFKIKYSQLYPLQANEQLTNFYTLLTYLTKFNNIINDVSMNLANFTKKYKVRCDVYETKDTDIKELTSKNRDSFRMSYDTDSEKNVCKNFKVCSNELKTFFLEIYNSINDTAVSVLRSYAEMFTRDVNTDTSNEKNYIVDTLFAFAEQIEKDVTKIFINHTNSFRLDKDKRKEANIEFLNGYVKNVIQSVKETINNNLRPKLRNLHKKISLGIQQDVSMNLGIEFGNLERDLLGKICFIFNICNGNTKTRRHMDNNIDQESNLANENTIYVKVELTMDDLNDSVNNNSKPPKQTSKLYVERVSEGFGDTIDIKIPTRQLDYDKYANISVTRTTLAIVSP